MNSIWWFICKRVAVEVTRLCRWGKPPSYVARSAGYGDPLSRDHISSTFKEHYELKTQLMISDLFDSPPTCCIYPAMWNLSNIPAAYMLKQYINIVH